MTAVGPSNPAREPSPEQSRDPYAHLVDRLADAETSGEAVRVSLALGSQAAAADDVTLAITSERGDHLDLLLPTTDDRPSTTVSLRSDAPVVRAVLTGSTVTVDDPTPADAACFDSADRMRRIVAMPLNGSEGVAGGIAFGWAAPGAPEASNVERLSAIADRIGRALERTRIREREQRLVDDLRSEVLSIPSVEGLEIHGRWRSPWSGVPLGGDWFDVVAVDDDVTVCIVGDVAGHGTSAAPIMLAARSYARAFAMIDPDPVDILRRLDTALTRHDTDHALATIAVGVHDRGTRTFTWVNGGLPSPIIRRADGTTQRLEAGRARLAGTGFERRTNADATIDLRPGDTLVFVTDGVLLPVEEAGVDIHDVVEAVERHGDGDLPTIAEEVLGLTAHGDLRTDDAVVLLFRCR